MPGEIHNQRTDYAVKLFEKKDFKRVSITNLTTELQKITGKPERTIPDILMLKHELFKLDLSINPPDIPFRITIIWGEVVKSSFRGFPKTNELRLALYRTLMWKDIFDPELLRNSIFGQKFKTEYLLKDTLIKRRTRIYLEFYYIQDDSIWECIQIDEKKDCHNFSFDII